jgi:ribosomal protein S18 acetylase RimI-like enzyme
LIVLSPMQESTFAAFAHEAVATYARDNVEVARWTSEEAMGRAQAEFAALLPQKLQTPDHHLYEIQTQPGGQTVGFLWFAVLGPENARIGYIFNIRIQPEYRGRGYAKLALDRIEDIAVGLGLHSIALHVFAFNTSAQALYRSVGYGITGLNMRKALRRDDS